MEVSRLTIKDKFFKNGRWYCVCSCTCGNEKTLRLDGVENEWVKSCGCLRKEKCGLNPIKHGFAKKGHVAPEFNIWMTMISRCENTNNKSFPRYGGRGIKVCERWHDFANFINDMGIRTSKELSIERKNNNDNYCPENCVWATKKQQSNNTRNNIFIIYKGETKTLAQWSRLHGMKYKKAYKRYRSGWTPERIFGDSLVVPECSVNDQRVTGDQYHVSDDPKSRHC